MRLHRVNQRCGTGGFTLLELAVVLMIIALVLGGGMVTFTASLKAAQYNATVDRMDAIETALLNYSKAFNRIPCPASLTLAPADTNYGIEAANKGTCTGGTPAANSSSSGTVEGAVPTRSLQLPDDYMYDAWKRRFRYAVVASYTGTSTLPSCAGVSGITVNDATGHSRTTASIYAIISQGANGHGGYTSNGVPFNSSSTSADELTNCHCDSTGAAASYANSYVQKLPAYDSGQIAKPLYYFDDIVTFKENWQMQAFNSQSSTCSTQSAGYVYVADSNNNRIEKFTTDGTYVNSYDPSDGLSLNGPATPMIDSGNNIWVMDGGNNRVLKLNSTLTSVLMGFGAGYNGVSGSQGGIGSVFGQFNIGSGHPAQMALSPDGTRVWATDWGNYRVQQFNTSTGQPVSAITIGGSGIMPTGVAVDKTGNYVWIAVMGGMGSASLYKCPIAAADYTSCTDYSLGVGSTLGKFAKSDYYSDYVAIDGSGNVWVSDEGNGRVQEFNTSTLTWVGSITVPGGTAGPTGMAFDSSGNIWITNEVVQEVLKYDTSGNPINSFSGDTVNYFGSSGSSGGQFNAPNGLAFGSQ